MGTDIHIRVEKLVDGVWKYVPPPRTWGDGNWPTWDDEGRWDDPNVLQPETRNYNLFAFLADVRNGAGFAGYYTHDRITPQFPHRGLPTDSDYKDPYNEANSGTQKDDNSTWLGDHSFTWATLTELLNAPWDIEFHEGGYVDKETYEQLAENECPPNWCTMVSGGHIVRLTPQQYNEMKANDSFKEGKRYHIFHQWTWRPLENCEFKRWLERDLVPIANGNTDTVRVIMGFDS